MNEQSKRIFLGVLLIVTGGVFLVQHIFQIPIGGLFIALLFAAAGAIFLYFLLKDREKWWLSIPGFTLLGLGALIALNNLMPKIGGRFGGAVFLGFTGLGFLVIFLLKPTQWWPIIPTGVLATLALVAGIHGGGGLGRAIFFLGIGATFAALGLHPLGKAEKWPWIPAGICLALGVLLLATSGALVGTIAGWIWAAAFIVVGTFFVIRALLKKE